MEGEQLSTIALITFMKSISIIFPVCISLIILSAFFEGCYYDNEELLYGGGAACDTIQAKFSTDVQQIINSKCAYSGCHDAATGAGSTVFSDHASISGKSGRIKDRAVVQKTMPPSGTTALSDAEVIKLKCWIESGSPNN
jgi:uncharacterized membrane protein